MRVVVFGGTTEGRVLSRLLAARGAEVTVCTATAYGREEQGEAPGIRVLAGRRTAAEMAEVLRGEALCVDATHPYAVEASRNIRAACAAANTPLMRVQRREAVTDGDVVRVKNAEEAARFVRGNG